MLVGAAIRMAECMGLHRDGATFGLNHLETHVRRLIWHQLAFLDVRTGETQGPRPSLRIDDYDTRLPSNIDDVDLQTADLVESKGSWTDTTFSLIRMEVNEMFVVIWVDRVRMERRELSLTAVLSKIEVFRRHMAAKYDHLIDERIPVQRCAKLVMSVLISRLHMMVLHRYHNSVTVAMPERLRQMMITAGLTLVESAIALETIPELRPWIWYCGAYQQYHTAFLLLLDVFMNPGCKEADRIWRSLDYIFETDVTKSRGNRTETILSELKRKTEVYSSLRKMRAPASMDVAIGARNLSALAGHAALENPGVAKEQNRMVSASSIGRASLPNVEYAGVSNGETLWALANNGHNAGDGNNDNGLQRNHMMQQSGAAVDAAANDLMTDIDWVCTHRNNGRLVGADKSHRMNGIAYSPPTSIYLIKTCRCIMICIENITDIELG